MGHSSPFWVQGICPSDPTRYSFGYLTCGRRLFGAKTAFMTFFMCLTIIMFCAGFYLIFPLYFPFKLWWLFCQSFFLQLHFMLNLQHFYGLFYHLIFSGFYLFNLFPLSYLFELSNLFIYSFVYSLFIRLFIRLLLYSLFALSFWAV